MIKLDLHTHSVASADGGIKAAQYEFVLEKGALDCIAITDHNRIDFAQAMHKQLGNRIIVGEEVMTTGGEVIGLFLKQPVPSGLTPLEAIQAIRQQQGIVYVPHPLETFRRGLSIQALNELVALIDIVEVQNGRAVFQNRGPQAATWAKLHRKLRAASSDAHSLGGLTRTYTVVEKVPTRDSLLELLGKGRIITRRPPLHTLLHPKTNRLRNKIKPRRVSG